MKVIVWLLLALAAAAGCSDEQAPTDGTDGDADADTDTDSDGDADSDSDADSDADSDGDTDTFVHWDTDVEECADLPWEVEVETLNILVLLDRSESMFVNQISTDSYAEVVQAAIDAIVEQNTMSGLTNFALNVFPSPTSCTNQYRVETNPVYTRLDILCDAPKLDVGGGVVEEPLVPFSDDITMDTYAAISDALNTVGQCGGTPICATLKWARKYLNSIDLSRRTFVLLATDGAPNCNPDLNPDIDACINASGMADEPEFREHCLDDLCAYNAAHQLAADGYRTYIIGVGDDVVEYASVLDTIAYWGGGNSDGTEESYDDIPAAPNGGTWYFPAEDAAGITLALEDVTNKGISCAFDVDWTTVPTWDSDMDMEVAHRCTGVNILGKIYGIRGALDTDSDTTTSVDPNAGKVLLAYMPDCSVETALKMGWHWGDNALDGATWNDLERLDTDVSDCHTVELCPRACEMLKVHGGGRLWETVTARFGCNPELVVE